MLLEAVEPPPLILRAGVPRTSSQAGSGMPCNTHLTDRSRQRSTLAYGSFTPASSWHTIASNE